MNSLQTGTVKKLFLSAMLFLMALLLCGFANRPELEDIVVLKDNRYSCSFDGAAHDFIVDLPENAEGTAHQYHNSGFTCQAL